MNGEQQVAKKSTLLENVFDFVEVAVFALVMVAVLFAFFIRIVGVEGDSMNDTLLNGDHLLLTKAFYTPDRGDIVVVTREAGTPLIKRVIAVEGDTVEINQQTGEVLLTKSGSSEAKVLVEPYVHYPNLPYDMDGPVTVPAGHVFVMGDHRNNSHDSRKDDLGCVSVDNIVGKAVWRFLPLDSFGGLYDNLV